MSAFLYLTDGQRSVVVAKPASHQDLLRDIRHHFPMLGSVASIVLLFRPKREDGSVQNQWVEIDATAYSTVHDGAEVIINVAEPITKRYLFPIPGENQSNVGPQKQSRRADDQGNRVNPVNGDAPINNAQVSTKPPSSSRYNYAYPGAGSSLNLERADGAACAGGWANASEHFRRSAKLIPNLQDCKEAVGLEVGESNCYPDEDESADDGWGRNQNDENQDQNAHGLTEKGWYTGTEDWVHAGRFAASEQHAPVALPSNQEIVTYIDGKSPDATVNDGWGTWPYSPSRPTRHSSPLIDIPTFEPSSPFNWRSPDRDFSRWNGGNLPYTTPPLPSTPFNWTRWNLPYITPPPPSTPRQTSDDGVRAEATGPFPSPSASYGGFWDAPRSPRNSVSSGNAGGWGWTGGNDRGWDAWNGPNYKESNADQDFTRTANYTLGPDGMHPKPGSFVYHSRSLEAHGTQAPMAAYAAYPSYGHGQGYANQVSVEVGECARDECAAGGWSPPRHLYSSPPHDGQQWQQWHQSPQAAQADPFYHSPPPHFLHPSYGSFTPDNPGQFVAGSPVAKPRRRRPAGWPSREEESSANDGHRQAQAPQQQLQNQQQYYVQQQQSVVPDQQQQYYSQQQQNQSPQGQFAQHQQYYAQEQQGHRAQDQSAQQQQSVVPGQQQQYRPLPQFAHLTTQHAQQGVQQGVQQVGGSVQAGSAQANSDEDSDGDPGEDLDVVKPKLISPIQNCDCQKHRTQQQLAQQPLQHDALWHQREEDNVRLGRKIDSLEGEIEKAVEQNNAAQEQFQQKMLQQRATLKAMKEQFYDQGSALCPHHDNDLQRERLRLFEQVQKELVQEQHAALQRMARHHDQWHAQNPHPRGFAPAAGAEAVARAADGLAAAAEAADGEEADGEEASATEAGDELNY